jgi:hypothetical protein
METITIEGKEVRACSPEGLTARMTLIDLIEQVAGHGMETNGIVLPDGVRWIETRGPITIWVHQTPPRVYGFKWIARDSPAQFGNGAKYRMARLALPYLIVFAAFEGDMLSTYNECFFRVAPLENENDKLLYPALLNCSRFSQPEGRPLSWICTQNLDLAAILRLRSTSQRMQQGLKALMHCLLETGFNYSSEAHEGSSWFTESTKVCPQVSTVEQWEKASAGDPLFVLEVPWLKTGLSVRQVAERIFKNRDASNSRIASSADLARIIFNNSES